MVDPASFIFFTIGIPAIILSIAYSLNMMIYASPAVNRMWMVKTLDHKKLPLDDFILEYERRGCEINKTRLEMTLNHTMELLEKERQKAVMGPDERFKLERFEDHRNFTVEKVSEVIRYLNGLWYPGVADLLESLENRKKEEEGLKENVLAKLRIIKSLNKLDIFFFFFINIRKKQNKCIKTKFTKKNSYAVHLTVVK